MQISRLVCDRDLRHERVECSLKIMRHTLKILERLLRDFLSVSDFLSILGHYALKRLSSIHP